MQQGLPVLAAHGGVCIAKHEPDRREEIALARTIAPDDHIVSRRERINVSLTFITFDCQYVFRKLGVIGGLPLETLDCNLLNMHDGALPRALVTCRYLDTGYIARCLARQDVYD